MKEPLLHTDQGPFSPVWSGFHDATLRPTLQIIKDGSGYRPATSSDFGNLLFVSGVTITGIIIGQEQSQICDSGNIGASNRARVNASGQLSVLSTPNGDFHAWLRDGARVGITGQPIDVSGSVGLSGGFVGISGVANVHLDAPVQVSGTAQISGKVSILTAPTFDAATDIIITGSGVAMQGSNVPCYEGVIVTAFPENSGNVFVGGSSVTTRAGTKRGLILLPGGMPSQVLHVGNVNQIYVIGDYSGDGVGVLAI